MPETTFSFRESPVARRAVHPVLRRVKSIVPEAPARTVLVMAAGLAALLLGQSGIAETRVRYVVTDYRGSPVVMVDHNGLVLSRSSYAPHGEETREKRDVAPDYIGFAGGTRIGGELAELVDMGGRHYSPELQRYLSPDLTGENDRYGRLGGYHYAGNNPYLYVAPASPAGAERLGAEIGPEMLKWFSPAPGRRSHDAALGMTVGEDGTGALVPGGALPAY